MDKVQVGTVLERCDGWGTFATKHPPRGVVYKVMTEQGPEGIEQRSYMVYWINGQRTSVGHDWVRFFCKVHNY